MASTPAPLVILGRSPFNFSDFLQGTISFGIYGSGDSGTPLQGTVGYAFSWQFSNPGEVKFGGAPFFDGGYGIGAEGISGGGEFSYSNSSAVNLAGQSYGWGTSLDIVTFIGGYGQS